MARALQKTLSTLLALVLAIAAGWQGASLADTGPEVPAPKPTCKCCDYDPAKCATPACCVRPADNGGAPVVPAPSRPATGIERHAIAASPFALATLPRLALHDLPSASPPIQAGAIPIFQRDCSFLI